MFDITDIICADHNGWKYLSQTESNWNEAKSKCQSQDGDFWKPTADMWDWVSWFIEGYTLYMLNVFNIDFVHLWGVEPQGVMRNTQDHVILFF